MLFLLITEKGSVIHMAAAAYTCVVNVMTIFRRSFE